MFEMTGLLFLIYSEHTDFLSIIARKYPVGSKTYLLIAEAHQLAKKEFGSTKRLSGEQYIRHLESTALITFLVLEGLKKDDPEMIVAALLHDLVEDIEAWTFTRLSQKFGMDVATLVQWVSEPELERCGGSKKVQEKKFQEQLEEAPFRAAVIKLADQLHNLMTLWAKSVEKQSPKVRKAKNFYHPLAKKHDVLVYEFHIVILQAEARLAFKSMTGLNPVPKFK